jgi:hypothetical protein
MLGLEPPIIQPIAQCYTIELSRLQANHTYRKIQFTPSQLTFMVHFNAALPSEHEEKVKVRLSLRLTKHHAMNTYWGSGDRLHAFLTSAVDGGEWSVSRFGRLAPEKEHPVSIGYERGWAPEPAGMNGMARRKNHSPCQESNIGLPARSLVTILTELPQLPVIMRAIYVRQVVTSNEVYQP